MYRYIKNGKPFESPDPIYYFEWIYKGGSTYFGMHGTENEYETEWKKDPLRHNRQMVRKIPVQETK